MHEYIGGELMKLRIHSRDPAESLDVSRFAEAGVSTAACARVGLLDAPGSGLHRHCNEEMGYLAEFLPRRCARETR